MTASLDAPPWLAPRPGRGKAAKRKSSVVAGRLDPLRREAFDAVCAEVGKTASGMIEALVEDLIVRAWEVKRAAGHIVSASGPDFGEDES